jgi:hypothetical protein
VDLALSVDDVILPILDHSLLLLSVTVIAPESCVCIANSGTLVEALSGQSFPWDWGFQCP